MDFYFAYIVLEDAYRTDDELSSQESRDRTIFSTRRKQYAKKFISDKQTKELMSLITGKSTGLSVEAKHAELVFR